MIVQGSSREMDARRRQLFLRVIGGILITLACALIVQLAVYLFFPTPFTTTFTQDGMSIRATIDRQFYLTPDACTAVSWQVTGARRVELNGVEIPATGSQAYCLQENWESPSTTSSTDDPSQTVSRGPSPVIIGYFPGDQGVYLRAIVPIYVLSKDIYWLWRPIVALVLLIVAARLLNPQASLAFYARSKMHLRLLGNISASVWVGALLAYFLFSQLLEIFLFFQFTRTNLPQFGIVFTPERLLLFLRAPLMLLVLGFYVASLTLFGAAALRALRLTALSPVVLLPTAFLLGQGLFALWLSVVLMLGVFIPPVLWASVFLAGLIGFVRARTDVQHAVTAIIARWRSFYRGETRLWRFIAVGSIILCLLSLRILVKPQQIDGLITYMLQARLFAVTGKVTPLLDTTGFFNFTSAWHVELHMGALLSLQGEAAARLFTWAAFAALCLTVIAIMDELGLRKHAKVLVLLLIGTTTTLTYLTADGKTDVVPTALALLTIYWSIVFMRQREKRRAVLVGLLSGLTVMAKITYAPTLGLFIILITLSGLWAQPDRTTASFVKQLALTWVIIGVAALLPYTLNLVRGALFFGEPLAPFIMLKPENASLTTALNVPWLDPLTIRRFRITYPIAAIFDQNYLRYGYLSPYWLAFLPLGVLQLFSTRPKMLRNVTLIAAICLYAWILSQPAVIEVRYALALIIVLFLLPIDAAAQLLDSKVSYKILRQLVTVFVVVGLAIMIVHDTVESGYWLLYSPKGYAECPQDVICAGYESINRVAAPNARVFSNSPYYYYFRDDLLMCASRTDEKTAAEKAMPADRWRYLYDRGFDYVVLGQASVDWRLFSIYRLFGKNVPLDTTKLPGWLKVETLYSGNGIMSLHLIATADAPPRSITCQQTGPRDWKIG